MDGQDPWLIYQYQYFNLDNWTSKQEAVITDLESISQSASNYIHNITFIQDWTILQLVYDSTDLQIYFLQDITSTL